MADPDSSIKSIFSGKVGFTDTDDELGSQFVQKSHKSSPSASGRFETLPLGDNCSVSSQNLYYVAAQSKPEQTPGKDISFTSSTNVSVASSGSAYQHPSAVETDTISLATNQGVLSESFSRPASRNSMASCLSTTATKDGVEGKKIYRHGPLPYFTNVITNMVQQQQQGSPLLIPQYLTEHAGTTDVLWPKKDDIDALSLPPVTLQEKMVLMNMESSE